MAVDVATVPFSQVHRFSLEEYHQLIESGGFDEDMRVELIEGVIVDMSRKTREHENAIRWLTRWLVFAVDPERHEVGVQTSLTTRSSEPEPDLTVIPRDAPRPYHPGSATLVIEVAVSSQHRDLRVKPHIYAQADVPEYWVVDVDKGRVVVHRDPTTNGYQTIVEVPANGSVQALSLPLPALDVTELLDAAARRG
jgi:Uma2 family endonuclease